MSVSIPVSEGVLAVGFDRPLEPKEDVRMYGPLLTYLERATGRTFHLHVTPRDSNIVDEAGKADFAIVVTLSYLPARERWGARAGAGAQRPREPTHRAAIVARPGSPVRSLADLQCRTFAFGAPNSTWGNLIPRMMLAEESIALTNLQKRYEYMPSHAATASTVVNGRYDIGGVQDTLALALQSRGLVGIVALSSPYPSSGIIVSTRMPEHVAQLVRKALLGFEPTSRDAAGLYHWDRSEMPRGFAPAQDEDYAVLRQWATFFGLCSPAEAPAPEPEWPDRS